MRRNDRSETLYRALAALESEQDVARFLEDLCTPAEVEAMADRWHVARLLEQGIPYRKINELSGVSTATITRVARCIAYGAGGYKAALSKQETPK